MSLFFFLKSRDTNKIKQNETDIIWVLLCERRKKGERMAVSIPILAIVVSLHLIAFVFAVGAERRRSLVNRNIIYIFFKFCSLFLFRCVNCVVSGNLSRFIFSLEIRLRLLWTSTTSTRTASTTPTRRRCTD